MANGIKSEVAILGIGRFKFGECWKAGAGN